MKEALDTDWPFPLFFLLLRIDCNLTVEIYLVENGSFNTEPTRIRGVSLSGKKIFLRVPSLAVVSRRRRLPTCLSERIGRVRARTVNSLGTGRPRGC